MIQHSIDYTSGERKIILYGTPVFQMEHVDGTP